MREHAFCSDAKLLQPMGWPGLMLRPVLQPVLGQPHGCGAGRLQLLGWEGCPCLHTMNHPPGLFLGSAPSWQQAEDLLCVSKRILGSQGQFQLFSYSMLREIWCGAGGSERPGLPGRKMFALAAQSNPGAKTQSVPLEPFPASGVKVFLGPGDARRAAAAASCTVVPPCQVLYVLGKPQAKGLPSAASAGCAAGMNVPAGSIFLM